MEGNQSTKPNNVRRFKPEPLETSWRTNRPPKNQISDISTSSQESKESYSSDGHTGSRNALGQANDKAKPPQTVPRFRTGRVLPQPTETSSRRSRKKDAGKIDDDEREHSSRNAPSPTSSRTASPSVSSGSLTHTSPYRTRTQNEGEEFQNITSDSPPGQESNKKAKKTRPLRRFLPEPVESMKRSRRRPTGESASNSARRETPRKFPPQLIGTGKRSFRRTETKQDLDSPYRSRRSTQSSLSAASDNSASDSEASRSFPSESRFSYANLLQRQEGRRHSFRVPDLPDIQSNSSEDSDDSDLPSRSTSPSGLSQKDTKFSTMNDQFRESCDERFSSYLLSLAARCAEKQLRDQALAAFPNEQVYQSVSHFAIDGDEDSDNERKTFRRESTTDITWELEEMRRHKEVAESKDSGQQGGEGNESRFSAAAIASRQLEQSTPFLNGWEKNNELKHMRHAASPPMLGHDIVFPMSVSPQGTTYEDEEDSHLFEERRKSGDGGRSTGLWTSYPHGENRNGKGLWGGLCRKDEDPDLSHIRTGIVTPRLDIEGDSYFSLNQVAHSCPGKQHPAKPSDSVSHLSHVDKMPGIETDIEREFHDGFVSQVYNYLSLGYPSLARYYDHELSKISGVSIDDLRKDDLHTDAMGYVGVPDGSKVDKDRTILDKCMRWSALRLYIREWAKQRPEMVSNGESLDAWGVRERRGSWAI